MPPHCRANHASPCLVARFSAIHDTGLVQLPLLHIGQGQDVSVAGSP